MSQSERELLVGLFSLLSGPVIAPLVYLWNAKTKSMNSSVRFLVPVLCIVSYLGFLYAWHFSIAIQGLISLSLFIVPLVYLMANESRLNTVKWRRKFVLVCLFSVPILPAVFYLLTPGYIVPLLNHPIARVIILCIAIWQLFSSFLFCLPWKVERLSVNYFVYFSYLIIVIYPMIILIILGPAVFTLNHGGITPLPQ